MLYLRLYFEYLIKFKSIDTEYDDRLNFVEFEKMQVLL